MILTELYFFARRASRYNSDAVIADTEAKRAKRMMKNFIFFDVLMFDEMSET